MKLAINLTDFQESFVSHLPKKFRGLGTSSVIPRKKVLIPRFTEESIPKLGTEGNGMKKISYTKSPAPVDSIFSSETCFGTEFRVVVSSTEWFRSEFRVLLIFLFHGTEFRVVFSSAEWFRSEFRAFASNFVPW
jgi:hypothetical protein